MQKNLSIIHSQGMRLAAMVSDIVDSASNMRKTLLIKHEEIALHAVAQSAVDTMATLVKRGVKLLNEVPADIPVVQADSSRLFQVSAPSLR
jgi:signal transduction histidine kinase